MLDQVKKARIYLKVRVLPPAPHPRQDATALVGGKNWLM